MYNDIFKFLKLEKSMSDFNIMEDSLLTMEQICEKLSISRSTLDRWRGIGNNGRSLLNHRAVTLVSKELVPRRLELLDNRANDEPIIPFPKPTLNIGRSPRWSANEINKWIKRLQQNEKN